MQEADMLSNQNGHNWNLVTIGVLDLDLVRAKKMTFRNAGQLKSSCISQVDIEDIKTNSK